MNVYVTDSARNVRLPEWTGLSPVATSDPLPKGNALVVGLHERGQAEDAVQRIGLVGFTRARGNVTLSQGDYLVVVAEGDPKMYRVTEART